MKVIETNYNGRRFRSRTEARWAVAFDWMGWLYNYEPEGVDLDGEWYLPDFYLPEFPFWFEVKGQEPNKREIRLARKLRDQTAQRVIIAVGPPALSQTNIIGVRAQMLVFDGERDDASDRWGILEDRRNINEFWLAQDEFMETFSIGPGDGDPHDRYPIVSDRIKRAYESATSSRFDGTDPQSLNGLAPAH